MGKKEKKEELKATEIKVKKVAKNLIVMVDKQKFVVPNVDDKMLTLIQNKALLYNKTKTEKRFTEIMDLIDVGKSREEEVKTIEKGIKQAAKKEVKKEVKEVGEKKKKTRELITKVAKTSKSKKVDYSHILTVDKKGNMVMKGCENIPMPDLLIKRITDFIDKGVDIMPTLNFWSLCLLNPNPIARTKLFDYLENNGLMITPSGYFVTYRMVKTTDKEGVYTAAHDSSMVYTPGTVCRIPREECDEDGRQDCSRGLHTGTPKFIGIIAEKKDYTEGIEGVGDGYGIGVKIVTKEEVPDSYGTGYNAPRKVQSKQQFNNSFGNQAIICLINPQHVVSIPDSNTRKMRSCEFYFCKLTTAEEVIDMVEKDYLLFDHDYQSFEFEDLQEMLKDKELKAYVTSKTEVGAKMFKLEKMLSEKKAKLKLGNDNINSNLDMIAIKAITNQRIKTIKS